MLRLVKSKSHVSLVLLLVEEVSVLLIIEIRHHSLHPRCPVGRTEFPVALCILKSLHESENLIYIPSYVDIIDGHVLDDSPSVYDEGGSKVHASIVSLLDVYSVLLTHFTSQITQNRELDSLYPTFSARLFAPLHVREFRVNRAAKDFSVYLSELLDFLGESMDLGRADIGVV